MIVQVNFGDVDSSPALETHACDAIDSALRHHADQVTRVEAHLRDDNSSKSAADDKRCTLEARIAGQPPLAVDSSSDDLYKSITEAAGKLGRAVKNKLERLSA
jgi:ribosome-associated translation inhibitor RaiA